MQGKSQPNHKTLHRHTQVMKWPHRSHGRRPSFTRAAKPQEANGLYEYFIAKIDGLLGKKTQTGQFGRMMKVTLVNDGPVTILLDTDEIMR